MQAKGDLNYGHLAKVGCKNPDTQRLARTRVVQLRSRMKAFVQSRRKGRETPREHAEGESPELNDRGVGTSGPLVTY